MGKKTLVVENVGMKFNLSQEKVDDFKEYFIRLFKGNLKYNEFWALKDVSFTLEEGDRLGILGLNGAGKSTLLKVIAGVFKPTEGKVTRKGKVVPLLELGAGFDKNYTGRENIYLYGSLLGYSKQFLDKKYDEIVKFSGLGKFIDVPVKNYSSGMRSKLGFSIATIAEPEILILDEVLSVGDANFRKKSEKKIRDMMEGGTTVLFVSHSLPQVERICNKAMILEQGKIVAFGPVEEIAQVYTDMLDKDEDQEIMELKRERRQLLQKIRARREEIKEEKKKQEE
ncbi:MAG: ABC transporter ATP-binding protein [Lachnospiraceae bacterium]|nr:ABC transporter ATP-binding protein [Lachnospiraceae bacterium]